MKKILLKYNARQNPKSLILTKKVKLALGCLAVCVTAAPVFAQTSITTIKPAATSIKPTIGLNLATQSLNITNWGIVERQGAKNHGKVGETLFIEGRDLDPTRLEVEIRSGSQAVKFTRKSGGTGSRVEFTIPALAYTGDMMVTLQARNLGTKVLSETYGVCETPKITTLSPSPIAYSHTHREPSGKILLSGQIMTIGGECLDELQFLTAQAKQAFRIGSAGIITIDHVISKAYNQVQIQLDGYTPPSNALRSEGPIALTVPSTGPRLLVDDARNIVSNQATITPKPAPLVPVKIDSVSSNTSWGGQKLPFVIVSTVPRGLTIETLDPFIVDSQIIINGQNITANPNTQWAIGTVSMGRPNINNMTTVPVNAVSGRVCATRSDGIKSCAPSDTIVIASPQLTTAPQGWPLLGNSSNSLTSFVNAPVRRSLTITGFNLMPPPGLGLEAKLTVSNFDHTLATLCNLDLKVSRFDTSTIVFSFGSPGGTRPAGCTELQENSMGFYNNGRAELKLEWVYQGQSKKLTWYVKGTH